MSVEVTTSICNAAQGALAICSAVGGTLATYIRTCSAVQVAYPYIELQSDALLTVYIVHFPHWIGSHCCQRYNKKEIVNSCTFERS